MKATPSSGPSGVSHSPPDGFTIQPLPSLAVTAGTKLQRVHQSVHNAIFFGPAADPNTGVRKPPVNRFDSATSIFGVLYCAAEMEGAFVETVMRNPRMMFVSRSYVRPRAVTELTCSRNLRFVDLAGHGLSALGLTNDISTGPYRPSQLWADWFWSHPDQPDGIAYRSRHDPQQVCYVVFERPDLALVSGTTLDFASTMPAIDALIRRYGKIPVDS